MVGHEEELGQSQTALTENIIKERRDFLPTRSEWSGENRDQHQMSLTSAGTFRTIEKNRLFFITGIHLSTVARSDTSVGNPTGVEIITSGSNRDLIVHRHTTVDGSTQTSSMNFTMPLKILGGELINLTVGTNVSARCSVFGFEESVE